MRGMLEKGSACLAVAFAAILVISGIPVATQGSTDQGNEPTGGPSVLVVGGQDKMKTRNPLPALADDVWTHDVLDRVYDAVGKSQPETEELKPYILKGIDANENSVFDANEYGVFTKNLGTNPQDIIAYYDFNGVYFHDGVQANASDLFFSYQLAAMNPRMNTDMRVLMDQAGKGGSNYSVTRWLFALPVLKNWQHEPLVGDPNLRFAVRFQLQETFALFASNTLAGLTLFPRHVWEDSGWRQGPSGPVSPLHADFGKAIYPETDSRFGTGIPSTETMYKPFVYLDSGTPAIDSAEEWMPTDDDVIGSGPFAFDYFNDMSAVARLLKFPDYYTGNDSKSGVTIDPFVATYIHLPYIDGIDFLVYASMTLGVLALMSGQVDILRAPIPPEFVPSLSNDPNIRIWTRSEPGFSYLSYNMRRPALGAWFYGMIGQFDIGLHFRRAIAHLIDKPTIVTDLLQGYGIPGVVPLSPTNVMFYNASLTGYDFSVAQALAEIDLAHEDALWLSANGGPAEAATWYTKDPGTGKYIMPGIGTAEFNLWCPNADYDPVEAASCTMIANEMENIGINVKAKPVAFSAIRSLINAHDFDLYISNWEIRTGDPGYFFDLFHSSNAASGKNFGGVNDPTLDWVLEESQKEMNLARRVMLIQWAQGILAERLPYDTLYFRTNIEAQRQDRFVGWFVQFGSIWNYWSLLHIHPPNGGRLSVGLDVPSAISSGDTRAVVVTVKNESGALVDGANVTLRLAPYWAGNFTAGGSPPNNTYTGVTSLGKLVVNYIAPVVTRILNVTITADVTYSDYPETSKSIVIEIYPLGANFLAVTVNIIDSDIVQAGGTTRLAIAVTEPSGFPMISADVSVFTVPSLSPPYGVMPNQGKAGTMTEVTFYAPPNGDLPLDVNPFVVEVMANQTGYYDGEASIGITVVKTGNQAPKPSFTVTPPSGGLSTVFTFDASASSDFEDPPSALEVRWDWENDGFTDTPWSTAKIAQHQYSSYGTYTSRLEVRDTGGAVNSTTRQVDVVADTSPPTVSILSPAQGQMCTATPIAVTGDAADTGGSGLQKVEVRVNGGSWSPAVGTLSWTASINLVGGSNTIDARAWDNAGNPSAIASVTVTYNIPPNATFTISPTSGDTAVTFSMIITASDAEDPVTSLQFRWDWENDGTWDTTWDTSLAANHRYPHFGSYYMALEVKDTDGLTNISIEEVKVRLAPPFDLAVAGGTDSGTAHITWEHPTHGDVDHYHVAVYGSQDAAQPIANETSATLECTITGLEPGKAYWFDAIAVDATGNVSNPSERVSGVATPNPVPQDQSLWWAAAAAIVVVALLATIAVIVLRRRRKGPKEEHKDGL